MWSRVAQSDLVATVMKLVNNGRNKVLKIRMPRAASFHFVPESNPGTYRSLFRFRIWGWNYFLMRLPLHGPFLVRSFAKIYWKSLTCSAFPLKLSYARVISHNELNVKEQFEQNNRHEVLIHYITKWNMVLVKESQLLKELLERTKYFWAFVLCANHTRLPRYIGLSDGEFSKIYKLNIYS